MTDCGEIVKIRQDELNIPDMCDVELLGDWKAFQENFGDPNEEEHPWKLKYLVALAFCKGWEGAYKRYSGEI
tara:strand:+ start:797 stop:1012 length:216 start_codon:yes stop_codon:yes gene_type:complete